MGGNIEKMFKKGHCEYLFSFLAIVRLLVKYFDQPNNLFGGRNFSRWRVKDDFFYFIDLTWKVQNLYLFFEKIRFVKYLIIASCL